MTTEQGTTRASEQILDGFLASLRRDEVRALAREDLDDLAGVLYGDGRNADSVAWHDITEDQIDELKQALSAQGDESVGVRRMRALRGVLRSAVEQGMLEEDRRQTLDERARMGRKHRYDSRGLAYESMRYGAEHWQIYFRMRMKALLDLIDERLPADRPLRILEIGCGTGVNLSKLVEARPNDEVYGSDFSMTMLRQAGEKLEEAPSAVPLVQGNGLGMPFPDGQFDLVYATRFIHQFDHELKKKIYAEMKRLTRPGGLLVVEFYGRSYRVFRYYTGRRRGRKASRFFQHYPSNAEVRDIVGGSFDMIPLRVGAARLVHRFFGESFLRSAVAAAGSFRFLADEYFVAERKDE